MIEILQFVFSSFWVWAGTAFIISSVATTVVAYTAIVRG